MPSHFIQHSRAYVALDVAFGQQVLDYGGKRKAGARPLSFLIEYGGNRVAIDDAIGQRYQRRMIKPIADVHAIRRASSLRPIRARPS